MEPPASVENWSTKWHYLRLFKIYSSGGATFIGSKAGHQVATLVDVANWVPGVTLTLTALLALSVSIELVSSSARVTSVKFAKGVLHS